MDQRFDKNQCVTPTVVFMAWGLFYIYVTIYAGFIFLQFSLVAILSVSISFAILFVCLAWPLTFKAWKNAGQKMKFKGLIWSTIAAALLILFFNTSVGSYTQYVKTYPLLDVESEAGVHYDTAFHVSLIRSILNFGYPSIAAHNHPFTGYHVLSHYVDALILLITRLDPFDSYGLFNHFKVFTYLSALLFLIGGSLLGHNITLMILSVFLLLPFVIGDWIVKGSHGLWMSSLVLVLSANYLFRMTQAGRWNTPRELRNAAIIIILVALGKISSGALLAAFLIPLIWSNQIGNKAVYLFIISLVAFFLSYSRLFTYGGSLTADFSNISLWSIYDFITESGKEWTRLENAIVITIILFLFMAFIYQSKSNLRIALSSIIGMIVLFLITKVIVGMSPSDIWYFHFGLTSVCILFAFLAIIKHARQSCENPHPDLTSPKLSQTIAVAKYSFLGLVIVLGVFVYQPMLNPLNFGLYAIAENLRSANLKPFESINKILSADRQMSIYRLLTGKVARAPEIYSRGTLGQLAEELNSLAKNSGTTPGDMLLYVPRTILENERWLYGMFVYAITGTPLINGVISLRKDYGLSVYGPDSLAVDWAEFDSIHACKAFHPVMIVMLKSLKPISYETVTCGNLDKPSIFGV